MPADTVLWIEIGIAALIGIVILMVRIEFAILLYGFALGFPDCATPLGATINVRLDDLFLLAFLARMVLWSPAPLSRGQAGIFRWLWIFLAACGVSAVLETALGVPPDPYDAARMAGCAVIFFVLPRILDSKKRLRFFVSGLALAGIALVIQVRQHVEASGGAGASANFQQLKSAATFDTWNPNTVGQAAILLVLGAGLGWILFSGAPAKKILWPCLAAGFALLPAFVFVRGSAISIAAAVALFLCLLRRWKSLLLFAALSSLAVLVLYARDRQFLEGAATVNVSTGEGLSSRLNRWGMAVQGIQDKPWLGHGFGQELCYLTQIGGEGVAHNDYLTVWLELGVGGLLLFLGTIFQFIRGGWRLYRHSRYQQQGALVLAATLALFLDSMGLPTLYWEKLPTITLSLGVALIGLCERNEMEIASPALSTRVHETLDGIPAPTT